MENSFRSPPTKRPFHALSHDTANGASKRRSKQPPPPLETPPGHAALRLLCHVSKIGGVIGKSGSVVKIFRQETGAKIRIEETVAHCEERVILIVAAESPKKKVALKGLKNETWEEELSPAQEAFLKIFERILDVEAEEGTATATGTIPLPVGAVSCRLLANTSQIGAVIGKGGKTIEKLRRESGATLKVLPPEQAPACANPEDEVIQVLGDVLAVKKAIVSISHILQDNPPSEKARVIGSRPVGITVPGTFPEIYEEIPHRSFLPPSALESPVDFPPRANYASRGQPVATELDRTVALDPIREQEVVFRILCSTETVGGIIGRGGTIVRALQDATGATIGVGSSVTETDERIITVSAKESPESQYSPAQDAVVRVFTRSVEVSEEKGLDSGPNKGKSVSARLLVSTKEVGCLMGKSGTIIKEMRKLTDTAIRILGSDKAPKCAAENDQVVQIVGEFQNVQDAVFHVTGRLRNNLLSNNTSNVGGPMTYSSNIGQDISPYGRMQEPSPPRLYPSVGYSHRMDRQNTLSQGMDHYGLSHTLDRPRSPPLWATHTLGGGHSRGVTDAGRGLASLRGGSDFGSGGKAAIVTNTTVEILVPEHILGSVYGDNGSNLSRLRQISGAKVVLHEPRPGTSDAIVIISGTPDQTQAAQSLLQAFILSGQSSPDHRSRRF